MNKRIFFEAIADPSAGNLCLLGDLLSHCEDRYYNHGDSPLTDQEYDLARGLLGTPKKVGAVSTTVWPKAKLSLPMGSLLKETSVEDTLKWIDKYTLKREIFHSHKLDGSSVELTYENGNFVRGVSRGDGETGDDLTPNISRMIFPKTIPVKGTVYIRGEVLIHREDWQTHFVGDRNPRNSAAGTMRRLDGTNCQHLRIYAFWTLPSEIPMFSRVQMLDLLKTWGFHIPEYGLLAPKDLEATLSIIEKQREGLPYEIDGVVLEENDLLFQEEMGVVDQRPRAARAFKFQALAAQTTLKDITWQVGRTGMITPVGELEPVDIGGVTVSRVMLNNPAQIAAQQLFLGCRIEITRRNDVIPYCERRIEVQGESIGVLPESPKACPSCKGPTRFDEVRLWCADPNSCNAAIQYRVYHFMKTLDVIGFGDKLIEKLFEIGKIKHIDGLYQLKVQDIANLEGLGEKVAVKVLQELEEKSKNVPLERFIKAIGIPQFSGSTAEIVKQHFPTLEAMKAATMEQLLGIDRIGPSIAEAINKGLRSNWDLIQKLLKHVTLAQDVVTGPLVGKAFCFTGYRDGIAEDTIKKHGGAITSSVTKKTTHLVAADPTSNSGKMKKARASGVQVIGPDELRSLLDNL